jgi:hypothetical protein
VLINSPVQLDVLDPPDVDQTEFGPDMKRWLSNVVDIINASFMSLNNALGGLIAVAGVNIGGGGAGPISVTVTGLTASGLVNVNLISSSNPVTIVNVTPGLNSFTITFSADPGASAIIVYQAFIQNPQGSEV